MHPVRNISLLNQMEAVETPRFISLNNEVRMQTFKLRGLDTGYAMGLQIIESQTI